MVGRLALKPQSEKSDLDGRIFPNLYRFYRQIHRIGLRRLEGKPPYPTALQQFDKLKFGDMTE